jgi:membrane protease YdiL (CAAX protease family)
MKKDEYGRASMEMGSLQCKPDGAGAAEAGAGPGRKLQLLEVLVFLSLILPSMALSFFANRKGSLSFDLVAYATILRDLALVGLVAFFLWRNNEPLSRMGWNFRTAGKEIAIGALLYLPLLLATNFLAQMLKVAGLSSPSTPLPQFLTARGWEEFALAFVLVVVVAIAEETIFRGYLILRLQAVTGSTVAAALLSSILFSLGHGYEGSSGVVTVGAMGLAFAVVYLWRRSLAAPMTMHFLQDFIGLIVLPLLSHNR